jgi:hypothetical protein
MQGLHPISEKFPACCAVSAVIFGGATFTVSAAVAASAAATSQQWFVTVEFQGLKSPSMVS